jgi:hypothetical protein
MVEGAGAGGPFLRQRCTVVAGWIIQDNLDLFLTTLSWIVGYSIDSDEWEAINTDLLEMSGDLIHEFAGNHKVKIEVAVDRATGKLQIRVDAPTEFESQVELAIAIFQNFHLRKRHS